LAGCTVHLVEETVDIEVANIQVDRPRGDAGVVAALSRGEGLNQPWSFQRLDEFGKTGRHFMDILDSAVAKAIRAALPSIPKRPRSLVHFGGVDPGTVVSLPTPLAARWLFVGLSWDIAPSFNACGGLSISAVYFDTQGQRLGVCGADSPEGCGARLGGTGILGQGIVVDLAAAPADAWQVLIVCSTADHSSAEAIQRPQVCVVDPAGGEVLRYSVSRRGHNERCLLVGRFLRCEDRLGGGVHGRNGVSPKNGAQTALAANRWGLQALSLSMDAATWEGSVDCMRQVVETPVEAYQPLPSDMPRSGRRCLLSL